jgi:hypothetical protein
VYWCRTRHRRLGGKMLKLVSIFFIFFSVSALACWRLEGTFAVDGQEWNISQKIEINKEQSFGFDFFILNVKIIKEKQNKILHYSIYLKQNLDLQLVSQGEEEIENKKMKTIFAKGKEKHPHSIINLKLTNI